MNTMKKHQTLLYHVYQKRLRFWTWSPQSDICSYAPAKTSTVTKDLSESGSFFLLNVPKYLGTKFFDSLYAQSHVFSEKYGSQKFPLKTEKVSS